MEELKDKFMSICLNNHHFDNSVILVNYKILKMKIFGVPSSTRKGDRDMYALSFLQEI